MKTEQVTYFTEKEDEFAQLLVDLGMKRNVAKVLIYLANVEETASRNIERGTDLRQPEVSLAMTYLQERKWIDCREIKSESKGRPIKIYKLAVPLKTVLDGIEKAKKKEAQQNAALIKKLREIRED